MIDEARRELARAGGVTTSAGEARPSRPRGRRVGVDGPALVVVDRDRLGERAEDAVQALARLVELGREHGVHAGELGRALARLGGQRGEYGAGGHDRDSDDVLRGARVVVPPAARDGERDAHQRDDHHGARCRGGGDGQRRQQEQPGEHGVLADRRVEGGERELAGQRGHEPPVQRSGRVLRAGRAARWGLGAQAGVSAADSMHGETPARASPPLCIGACGA